jgi:hypothetical protein
MKRIEKNKRSVSYSSSNRTARSAGASILRTGVKTILSRRDYRTKPGVLTPGICPRMIRPAGAADTWYQQRVFLASYLSEEPILASRQGAVLFPSPPGVKTAGLVLPSLRDRSLQLTTKSTPHHSPGALAYWNVESVEFRKSHRVNASSRLIPELHLDAQSKIERQELIANRVFCGLSLELCARTVIDSETVLPKAAKAAGKMLPRLNLGVVSAASPRCAATISLERRVVSKQ